MDVQRPVHVRFWYKSRGAPGISLVRDRQLNGDHDSIPGLLCASDEQGFTVSSITDDLVAVSDWLQAPDHDCPAVELTRAEVEQATSKAYVIRLVGEFKRAYALVDSKRRSVASIV